MRMAGEHLELAGEAKLGLHGLDELHVVDLHRGVAVGCGVEELRGVYVA